MVLVLPSKILYLFNQMIIFQLKDLISNECDLLYECKVCRNIFRSLANFISHKRVYCTERFNSSLHGQFFKAASTVNILFIIYYLFKLPR